MPKNKNKPNKTGTPRHHKHPSSSKQPRPYIPINRPDIGKAEINAVTKVLESGNLAQGQKVQKFEKAFARFCGTKHGIAVNSGTAALTLALISALKTDPYLDPKPWNKRPEVITTPFTFVATANSIIAAGARPIFVDIDPDTFNIDPDLIKKTITPKTKAILPVHLFGLPCEMDKITDLASKHDLTIIEDACQAHGAEYKKKRTGSLGDAGAFSFYPTKNMTTGEGGMITTNDPDIQEQCALLKNQGQQASRTKHHSPTYQYATIGYNWRMTDISAAIGLIQLKKLNNYITKRRRTAKQYDEAFSDISGLLPPITPSGCKHVFHQYSLKTNNDKRDPIREHLLKEGINTGLYYPNGLHTLPQFKYRKTTSFKNIENIRRRIFSIPIYPKLIRAENNRIISSIVSFFR